MTKVSMNRCLLDMPYEILFEIFCALPKDKLSEISRLCPKLGEVAGDKRLWKDVYINYYEPPDDAVTYAFEELYSGPAPVKVINLSFTKITPPVSYKTDQIVKVKTLNLSGVQADKSTMGAILAKYHFTELHLDYSNVDRNGHINGIAPEALSNRSAFEVLSLRSIQRNCYDIETENRIHRGLLQWLTVLFSKYCKNLKTLDLNFNYLLDRDMLTFVKNLPTSLEKLCLVGGHSHQIGNSFFQSLAKSLPNLKELGLCPARVRYPSLLEFKCLEALHVILLPYVYDDIRDLYIYLIRFPALKTVYIDIDRQYRHRLSAASEETIIETLRATLKPHGITTVRITEHPIENNNFWQKTNAIHTTNIIIIRTGFQTINQMYVTGMTIRDLFIYSPIAVTQYP